MSKLLLLMLLVIFLTAVARLVSEGEWELVASLLVGILTSHEQLKSLWDETEEGI